VAYDIGNLSILSVVSLSEPEVVSFTAEEYLTAFSLVLAPQGSGLSPNDHIMSSAFIFEIGWILRLYQDDFSGSDDAPLSFLRGMLTVPLQFSVAAWQWVNATVFALDPESSLYALPEDMKTTASSAQRTYRALTKVWIIYVFMLLVSSLLIYEISLLVIVGTQREVAPNTSSFSEIDASSKSTCPLQQNSFVDYASELQRSRLGNAYSDEIVQGVRNKKIRVVESDGPRADQKSIVVAVEDINEDVSHLPGLCKGVEY